MTVRRLYLGILILLVGTVLVGPVSATIIQNPILIPDMEDELIEDTIRVEFDTSLNDQAISKIFFYSVKPDTRVDFVLYYANSSMAGSVDYRRNGWGYNKSFSLGDQVSSYDGGFPALGAAFCVFYGVDHEAGKTYLSIGDAPPFGEDRRLWVEAPGIMYAPVHKVGVEASHPINVQVYYGDPQAIQECLRVTGSSNVQTDWVGTLKEFVGTTWGLVTGVILLLKHLLFDRWLQILVVFESVAIGYSCYNARDFIGFIKKFTRINEKAITMVAHVIAWIADFFFKIIQAVKPF